MNHAGGVSKRTANHKSWRKPRLTRPLWLLRCARTFAACLMIAGASGCTALQGVRDLVQYNDVCDDFVIGWRNYVWANQAWHGAKPSYRGHPQLKDFGEGFRAGYRDVAAGGSGCPPPLPPRKYWSWKYQSPDGQAKVAAWFAGYPHGAATAEQECAGNWRQIQVSHVIEEQYSPEFQQARVPRADGSPYPQPARGPTSDPRIRPMDRLPQPFENPLGPAPPPPATPDGPASNDETTWAPYGPPHVMQDQSQILQAGHRVTDQPVEFHFDGHRVPEPSGFIGHPNEGAEPRVLIAR